MSQRLQRAIFLFNQGHFIEAEAELRAALSEGDDSSHVHALLGLCLLKAQLPKDARLEMEAALARDPNDAYNHYAMSFVELPAITRETFWGRRRTAVSSKSARGCLQCALRAVELAPHNELYLDRLAEVFQMLGRWEESIGPAKAALRLSPGHCSAAIKLAETLTRLRQPAEARRVLHHALEMNPAASLAHAGMGWALLRAGDHERAGQFFNEALRMRADLSWAQEGALECAKRKYRLHRWLASFKVWFEGRHWLVAVITGLLLAAGFFGFLFVYFVWVDPVLRKLLGNGGFAAFTLAWILGGCALVFFHDEIFLWLVRRNAAANTSVGMERRRFTGQMLMLMGAGAAFVPANIFLERFSQIGPSVLTGLVPGTFAIFVTVKSFPAGRRRRFWLAYVLLVLLASPFAVLGLYKFTEEIPKPMHMAIVMFLPLLPVLFACDAEAKRAQRQKHLNAVDAARRTHNFQPKNHNE